MSSKEQLTGIEQINDAVTQLDQQTQQNAQIASQAHDVAVITDDIAKLVVSNANAKQFIGKDEVKAKNVNIKASQTLHKKEPIKPVVHKTETKVVQNNTKSNEDEWESF
jgi:methyl-accepting chemotaxis protein